MAEAKQTKKTVAVVGSGMAGLVSAYLIQQDSKQRYEVEVFETQDQLSLDSASYTISSVDRHDSQPNRVDIPMRAFDDGFHINLKRMYDYLGVRYMAQKFVYSLSIYSATEGTRSPYFLHSSSNHQIPPLRPASYGYAKWITQLMYLAICYFWFTACCFLVKPKAAAVPNGEDESLRMYLQRIRLPWHFSKNYLLPLMSSVTTCSHNALLAFPAVDAVGYAKQTYRQPHYTVVGGVQDVQAKLSKGLVVHLRASVTAVAHLGSKVRVTWLDSNEKGHSTDFDHVIMAVTPNVVGTIYEPLHEVMNSIPIVCGESVVHHDTSAVADCSQSLKRFSQKSCNQAQILHICTDLSSTESIHQLSSVLVTNFPISPIDPNKVVHRARLTRVLRTPKSRQAVNDIFTPDENNNTVDPTAPQEGRVWRNGNGNVWLVGAWCWDGMVLLEGCVVSAMRVATSLGVEVPWTVEH